MLLSQLLMTDICFLPGVMRKWHYLETTVLSTINGLIPLHQVSERSRFLLECGGSSRYWLEVRKEEAE